MTGDVDQTAGAWKRPTDTCLDVGEAAGIVLEGDHCGV